MKLNINFIFKHAALRYLYKTCEYLKSNPIIILNSFRNPLAQMEEEKREHDNKMKKMEGEMEQVFEMKVNLPYFLIISL